MDGEQIHGVGVQHFSATYVCAFLCIYFSIVHILLPYCICVFIFDSFYFYSLFCIICIIIFLS